MECTTAKPAIEPNQPPIPEEILLHHFPEKHSKFLKHKESLKTHIRTCSDNYHYIKADSKGVLPEKAKFILLKTWYDKYWYFVDKLQDYVDEYYKECAQMIELGIYEMKRCSETVATTSKVRRNEHHLISSHNRLKDSQHAPKPMASTLRSKQSSHKVSSSLPKTATDASDIEQPEYSWTKGFDHALETLRQCLLKSERASHKRSHHIQPRTKPNHPVDVEMAQRRPSSHQSLTRPQRKVEHAHSEPHAITQEGCKPSTEVVPHQEQRPKPAPSSQSDWKQIIAQTSKNLDSPESRFKSHENSSQQTSSPAANIETNPPSHCILTRTHRIMRACGDTSSTLSRAELSKNLDVVSEPHRTELENIPPTPRGHIDNDRLSPRVQKQSTDDQTSKGLNTAESRLKFRKNSNHEVLSHAADVEANTSSCGMPSQVHSDKDNPKLDCRSLTPDGLKPSNHMEMESKKTHKIMRASGDTTSTLLRVKHSKYSDMVPEPRNFESKSISPTPRDRIDADCRSLHVWKPPDAMFGRLQRIIVVSSNVDLMSAVKHSHLQPEAQIVPPQPTRSSQELLTQY
ncbi:hypothetical protein JOM56_014142 [Amanita muscaria]